MAENAAYLPRAERLAERVQAAIAVEPEENRPLSVQDSDRLTVAECVQAVARAEEGLLEHQPCLEQWTCPDTTRWTAARDQAMTTLTRLSALYGITEEEPPAQFVGPIDYEIPATEEDDRG